MSQTHEEKSSVNVGALLVCILLGLALWFSPHPDSIPNEGWHMLAIFVATIVGVILKPLPMGAVAFIALALILLTKTLPLKAAMDGFASPIVWLVVFALFIAKGFNVTGLGTRLAYLFTMWLGKGPLGLSYGLAMTDLMMAPAIPSVTGRLAGIVLPIMQRISDSYESFPNSPTARKLGSYLCVTLFQTTVISCTMFMTAMAANPLLEQLTNKQQIENVSITWGTWALAAIVPGLLSLLCIPLIIHFIYPPHVRETPEAPRIAREKLKELGPMKGSEWIMAGTVVILLLLWGFGSTIQLDPMIAAMIGLSILMLTGILDWHSLVRIFTAWETMFWFAILLTMAGSLGTLGVIPWFNDWVQTAVHGIDWRISFPILALFYFYSHYAFASCTAHVASMYIPFLLLSIALGTPPMLATLVLIFFSNLFGGLTHYSLTPAPIMYGMGYVDIKDWWRIGFIISVVNILIWCFLGAAWWKLLGLW
ncbi:MAG: anion permease [Gammaproteobacteria bacterium]